MKYAFALLLGLSAVLGATAQAARPSPRRKLLTDPESGLLGRCAYDTLAAKPQVPPWILERIAGPSMANRARP